MLNFNEGKVCEAIVRRLEEREMQPRDNLRFPEEEHHPHPIEASFTLGSQLFALEHTGIEPFAGHIRMEAESERLFAPITNALNGALGTDSVFELHMSANAFQGLKKYEVQAIQQVIVEWVKKTAPTVPKRPYADYKGAKVGPVTIIGVPFAVSLYRFQPAIVTGIYFQIRHLVSNADQLRKDRISAAIDKKFPKLAAWKKYDQAKTVLVLEENDIQLTNPAIVTDTFLPLVKGRSDVPDETYLLGSCMKPWYAWPILIGDKSYFDIARSDDVEHWEFDPTQLVALTKR